MKGRHLYLSGVSEWTWVEGEEGITMLVKMNNGDIERRHYWTLRDVYEVVGGVPADDNTEYGMGYRNLVDKLLKNPIHGYWENQDEEETA